MQAASGTQLTKGYQNNRLMPAVRRSAAEPTEALHMRNGSVGKDALGLAVYNS